VSEGINIEVMGHKGKITRLLPRPKGLFSEEAITAVVEFDPPVDGTLSLYVGIPPKDYTREELIIAVTRALQDYLVLDQKMKAERESQEARKKKLEALVDGVKKAVGLAEN